MGDKITLGPTGQTVAANVKHHRQRLGLSVAKLARLLDEIGSPIPVLGGSRIESRERRVSADDLVALASALQVTVVELLMPRSQSPDNLTFDYSGAATPVTRHQIAKRLGMNPDNDPSLKQELISLLATSTWNELPPTLTWDELPADVTWDDLRPAAKVENDKGAVDGDD